jgi:SSS family solute:Na+ symporter
VTVLDFAIFGIYLAGVVAVGFYFFRKNKDADDYYVGGRSVAAHHVGLSIVATDVGGGFSIGLGGLGFAMGLAGSWLLFTGFIGAWLSAVFIIPRIKRVDRLHAMYSYPDFLRYRFGEPVALLAALISGIGYLGFTGGQILAGATLSSETLFQKAPFGLDPFQFSIYMIAGIAIGYTVIGGLKAVIYTDTIQWIILLFGLIFLAIPLAVVKIGGLGAMREALPDEFFSLTNLAPTPLAAAITFFNWMITIIPIWLIGMTLYQRMFACRDEKEAKKAWYIAGVFEWPIMAFMGVFLGMCARVLFPEIPVEEAEKGLPRLIKTVLPAGITGIVIASYFSAIMSTADSCLMASSGNFVNDIIQRHFMKNASDKALMRLSMVATLVIGVASVLLASVFGTVLEAIVLAYQFMVSGLFVPTLGAYFWKRSSSAGALAGMISGGVTTLSMIIYEQVSDTHLLSAFFQPGGSSANVFLQLDPVFYGIIVSAIAFVGLSLMMPGGNGKHLDGELFPEVADEKEKAVG